MNQVGPMIDTSMIEMKTMRFHIIIIQEEMGHIAGMIIMIGTDLEVRSMIAIGTIIEVPGDQDLPIKEEKIDQEADLIIKKENIHLNVTDMTIVIKKGLQILIQGLLSKITILSLKMKKSFSSNFEKID